jgi:hypothetical protein
MWRIYSPNADAVRIRSTVRRLLESLTQARSSSADTEAFIGKVKYLSNQKLMAYAETIPRKARPSPGILASTLLVKRPALKHEREVRLVLVRGPLDHQSELFSYKLILNT